jgi:hypothetical protein
MTAVQSHKNLQYHRYVSLNDPSGAIEIVLPANRLPWVVEGLATGTIAGAA